MTIDNKITIYVGGNKSGLLAWICRMLGSKLHWLWLAQKGWQTQTMEFTSMSAAINYLFKLGPE